MSSFKTFSCRDCSQTFRVATTVLDRYPGWKPAQCLACKDKGKSGSRANKSSTRKPKRKSRRKTVSKELNLTLAEVLERFEDGPQEGVFTDGACTGNPGPGGWGVVWVEGGEVREQLHGHAKHTTNNRMELTALIEAYRMLPEDAALTIWSDSQLCVKTVNEWAAGWRRLGWKRKAGPIANLDLVRPLFELSLTKPGIKLRWIAAHDGSRWNEYADSLATAYSRDEL